MTKIFLDAEFTGLHQNTTQISIGLISDCDKTFYAEFNDFDRRQLNDWIVENILTRLEYTERISNIMDIHNGGVFTNKKTDYYKKAKIWGNTQYIRDSLHDWLSQFEEIEMWSDCLAYDWVVFCELFGGALKIPKHIYYIPFDICTLFKMKGIDPDINREEFAFGGKLFEGKIEKHNALWDAKIIKICYDKLIEGKKRGEKMSSVTIEELNERIEKTQGDLERRMYIKKSNTKKPNSNLKSTEKDNTKLRKIRGEKNGQN